MTQADRIIEKFGGITAMSKILGHKHPTTVQGWKDRGFIPSSRHREVLEVAKRENIEVTPDDFFAWEAQAS